MYIIYGKYGRVAEIHPDVDPENPDLTLEERFPPETLAKLHYISDSVQLDIGYASNEATGLWEYMEEPKPYISPLQQALMDRVAELEDTNHLLQAQVEAQTDQMDFYEECIVEMASVIYA